MTEIDLRYYVCPKCGKNVVLAKALFFVKIGYNYKVIINSKEYPAILKEDQPAKCVSCGFAGNLSDFIKQTRTV